MQQNDTPCLQFDALDDYWVHDASLTLSRDTYIIRVGASNIFNDAPPLTDNNNLSNLGGIGYDISGRTFFANITKRF